MNESTQQLDEPEPQDHAALIAEVEALYDEAGPWTVVDAAFIAASRTLVPQLVAALRQAEERIRELERQQLADVTLSYWARSHLQEIDQLRAVVNAQGSSLRKLQDERVVLERDLAEARNETAAKVQAERQRCLMGMGIVEAQFHLAVDYAEDGRYAYPLRWAALKQRIESGKEA